MKNFAIPALLMLVACNSESVGPAPDPPRFSVASAVGSPVSGSATGDAHILIFGDTVAERFSFSAIRHTTGLADGQFELFSEQDGGLRVHGSVTCVSVAGNQARIGGVVDQSTNPVFVGRGVLWTVVDMGEGAGAPPDLTSDFFLASPAQVNFHCAVGFFLPLIPVQYGNLQVHEPGADSFSSNVIIPINLFVFVPCAAGGAGELVALSGDLHLLFHFTADGSGGFHATSEANPMGVSGSGLTTGDRYQGTGVTRSSFNTSGVPFNSTFVNNFRIIGQGTDNNFLVHENFHITVNANGELTALVDNFSVECK
ncbi:MAG: hypothetical protein HY700_08820 [Gemmatimonadetes bacterium]|nr:hypothetical protein [Gemmatimonadota bacterium]